ncbi:MAG: hypothetical protein MJZ37_04760 [Bacilli bacterium]|nr:hypothetical protein [Bacilli bacterium]
MIENNKTELVEEEIDENFEKNNAKFLRTGTIIIGSILLLMVACFIAIVILEK